MHLGPSVMNTFPTFQAAKKKQTIFILILIYSEEIGTAAIERETQKPTNRKTCPADSSQASG